jgi:hypothetical protein
MSTASKPVAPQAESSSNLLDSTVFVIHTRLAPDREEFECQCVSQKISSILMLSVVLTFWSGIRIWLQVSLFLCSPLILAFFPRPLRQLESWIPQYSQAGSEDMP